MLQRDCRFNAVSMVKGVVWIALRTYLQIVV
jgi:hypothetical protein